jgi:hypothetical protein
VAVLTAAAFSLKAPYLSERSRMTRIPAASGIIVVGMWIIGIRIVIVGVAIAVGTVAPIVTPVVASIVAFIIAPIRHAGGQGDNET